jgi:hypothetical protein
VADLHRRLEELFADDRLAQRGARVRRTILFGILLRWGRTSIALQASLERGQMRIRVVNARSGPCAGWMGTCEPIGRTLALDVAKLTDEGILSLLSRQCNSSRKAEPVKTQFDGTEHCQLLTSESAIYRPPFAVLRFCVSA